ncbi:MAG: type II toxin-antitoxin system PemK/MazF family toxin [Elusimicrobia bacterium]|nr:type II toxin-antitoxin system PemK/MazF family toxin [Elusimicrobiota bacterium]
MQEMGHILRGDIYLVDFGESEGHTIRKKRPVVVIQYNLANRLSQTVIITVIRSNEKVGQLPVGVKLETGLTGLDHISYADLGHIYTVDKEELLSKIGTVPKADLQKMDEAIKISLGLK